MPACITHYQFAQEVQAHLGQPIQNPCAYAWGAQGPDFLFCHRYLQAAAKKDTRSLREYGSALHKGRPSLTLNAIRGFLQGRDNPCYRSYALGFLCHYALDSTAHPYVNARARELAKARPWENASTMHGEVEAALDAIVLRWKTGALPSEVKLGDMFPKNEGVQRQIARLYREVLFTLYGTDVSEEALYQATRDAHLVFSTCTDRTGLKRAFFQRLERGRPGWVTSHLVPITEDPAPDFANESHSPWQRDGAPCSLSFFELYAQALELAVSLAQDFDHADFAALTGERPFG